ncbi:MAG: DUF87 domain-containing protein [Thermofilaceae archaeon]
MYLPGASAIILFFAMMLALIAAIAGRTVLPPAILALILGGYYTYAKRVELVELVYGERSLLLDPITEVKVKRDFILLKTRRGYVLSAFLKVDSVDLPESDVRLGEMATHFVSSLYLPSATVNIVSSSVNGLRNYYLKINFVLPESAVEALKSVPHVLAELQRRLLGLGVRTRPVEPLEVLSVVAELNERDFHPTLPVFSILMLGALTLSLLLYPALAPLALILLPIIPLELRIVRGGRCLVAPKTLIPVRYSIAEVPDQAGAASIVRSFASAFTWSDDSLLALLVPEDLAAFEASVKRALEVLEAGRAGVSKLADEFKALNVINMNRALEGGSKPFSVAIFVSGDVWRYEPLGLERDFSLASLVGRSRTLKRLTALVGYPLKDSQVKISSQLAWLAPYTFFRPRTRRTPRAIYLGRGVRRDEEVWLELDLLENVHGLIVGPMGSGKSTTARTLALRAMEKGITPIIVDPSGEYRAFAERFEFEILDLWDRPFNPLLCSASDFERALTYLSPLSEYEAHLLRRCLARGVSNFQQLVELAKGTSLEWKLERLQDYFMGEEISLEDLISAGKPFVLCMGSTAKGSYMAMPVEVQRVVFDLLLSQLRDCAIARGLSEPRWLLIVDEGHLFMLPPPGYTEPLIVTMARMLRKFGLAVVMLTHEWGDVPEAFRRVAGWKLALSHSDPDYVSMTQVYMALTPIEVSWFQAGVVGRAVLRRGHEPYNILVEIEPVEEARTDWASRKTQVRKPTV